MFFFSFSDPSVVTYREKATKERTESIKANQNQRNGSALRAIMSAFGFDLLYTLFLKVVVESISFANPMILK